jgi:hypothetical protein
MTRPRTFFECLSEGLTTEERIAYRKRGLPLPEPPARLPEARDTVVIKKSAASQPTAPTVPAAPPPSPSAIDVLKREVAGLTKQGIGPWDAWCRARRDHPELVERARQEPIRKAAEPEPAVVELRKAQATFRQKTQALVKAGVVSNEYDAILHLATHEPEYIAKIRPQGRVPA